MPLGLQTANLNFELNDEIGSAGKNSTVFKAYDHQLSGTIVIKRIRKDAITYENDFYKEAKILYNNEHSNVAKVNYGCEDDTYAYIAMPFYSRGSLKNLLEDKFLSTREIIRYAIQFLSGLAHIHSNKLMHLDIKPDNIFITDSDEAVLADFGLARALDIYNNFDTPFVYYKQVPPEHITGNDMSLPFDIYLAGLTLYKMCNGSRDFEDQYDSYNDDNDAIEADILAGEFPKRRYLLHIPLALTKIINKSISVDPANRYQNALQLINDLALIDRNLDWNYIETDDYKEWSIDLEKKVNKIRLSENGNNFDVIATKTMKGSGNETKITEYCITNILSKDLKKFIGKALKELQ